MHLLGSQTRNCFLLANLKALGALNGTSPTTSMPSFGGSPRQPRRSFRVNPHAVSPTFDATYDVPVMEDSVLLMDAHCSQARMQSTFLHLHPRCRRPLATHRSGARLPRIGARHLLGQKCWRLQTASEMKSASFAYHGVHLIGSQTRDALGALDGTSPAPSHNLMRGQPDALFQWRTLTRDRNMGHLEWTCGSTARPCAGNAPLNHPG